MAVAASAACVVRAPADTNDEIATHAVNKLIAYADTLTFDLSQQLVAAEAIVRGMFQERPVHPAVQRLPRDFLEEKTATGPENSTYLCYRRTPVRYVMEDAEIEDGIKCVVWCWNGSGVGHSKVHCARVLLPEPTMCLADECDIKIECIHPSGTESSDDDLGADAAATADLQNTHAIGTPSEMLEQARLILPLQRLPYRIVHQRLLDAIELHNNLDATLCGRASSVSHGPPRIAENVDATFADDSRDRETHDDIGPEPAGPRYQSSGNNDPDVRDEVVDTERFSSAQVHVRKLETPQEP